MISWVDEFLHNAKIFVRKNNLSKRYHHERIEERSFLDGVNYAIANLEIGDKMIWMKAGDIDQYLEDKNRSILTRKENGWGEFEYSVQKIKELEGFKLTVFKAASFGWSFIEEPIKELKHVRGGDHDQKERNYTVQMTAEGYKIFENELRKKGFAKLGINDTNK